MVFYTITNLFITFHKDILYGSKGVHAYMCVHVYICICYYTFWSGVAGLSARGGRADKPQHHDKRCNKMFITVDWSLLAVRVNVCIT